MDRSISKKYDVKLFYALQFQRQRVVSDKTIAAKKTNSTSVITDS